MAQVNQVARSSNRFVLMIDGKVIGYAQSASLDDDYAPEPLSGIGDIHVRENVPTMARHTVQVQEAVVRQKALRDLGVAIENGDGALQGVVFDIVVTDKADTLLIRKYVGCSYARGSVDVRKHAIVMASATFMALDVIGTGA
jgi:hypothetical protein